MTASDAGFRDLISFGAVRRRPRDLSSVSSPWLSVLVFVVFVVFVVFPVLFVLILLVSNLLFIIIILFPVPARDLYDYILYCTITI